MSVLVCPVCQAPMREISRDGVQIDTCTRCRGVWLDRGELEKLSGLVGDQGSASFVPNNARPNQAYQEQHRRTDDDDDDDRRRQGYGRPQKSKMSRFMDFFD